MMRDAITLFDLSVEVEAVAMIVSGLGNQLDSRQTDTLTQEAMKDALFGVQTYLRRISADLEDIDDQSVRRKGCAAK